MSPLLRPLCITISTTARKIFNISLAVELLMYSKKYFLIKQNKNYSSICKSITITSPTGFSIALTNVDAGLKQRCINVSTNVVQRCFHLVSTLGTDIVWTFVQCCKSDVGFCFIFTFGSTLFQRWFTTLKQRWSDVEMLAGNSLWYVFSNKALSNICNMHRLHISSLKSKWFYNWTLNRKAHLFYFCLLKKNLYPVIQTQKAHIYAQHFFGTHQSTSVMDAK